MRRIKRKWYRHRKNIVVGAIAVYAVVTFIHFANGHRDESFFGIYHTAMVVKTCPLTPSAYWQFLHSTGLDRIEVANETNLGRVEVSSNNERYYLAYCKRFGSKDEFIEHEIEALRKELESQITP